MITERNDFNQSKKKIKNSVCNISGPISLRRNDVSEKLRHHHYEMTHTPPQPVDKLTTSVLFRRKSVASREGPRLAGFAR